MNTEKIYLSFKVGRGGHFHNPGYVTFLGEFDFQELINRCSDDLMLIDTTWDEETYEEVPLPESEWKMVDTGDNIILEGKDEIEAKTGVLDFDGDYDKAYTITLDEVWRDEEWEALRKAFKDDWSKSMSAELRAAIIDHFDDLHETKTIKSIKRYPTTLEVCFTDGSSDEVDFDQTAGEFTQEHWADILEQRGYDEDSIEKVLDELEWTSNAPFFSDNN